MIKIKVSYQDENELQWFLKLFDENEIKKVKIPKNQEGQFKKAYIIFK